ncbi:substrate-binding domain-containing protein [Luteibacter aegosomatissinici]|uniref:substrate-binding domain-containing protein n=1 Tax=Luteibacter aegosomatissinici TaxID=2911539 RepID=UPI001FF965AC|nr:substrate-binding domain-containing protein [Luteibacter aegosomatissinici]UPG92948.1 substrate-binding domain-containing protein [Luteibacter aegosomatissinici]
MKFVAGAVLLSLASIASAQSVPLTGGGATLPAIGYTGSNATGKLVPAAGSLLYVYANNTGGVASTYCTTGSGAGKKILAGNDPSNFGVNNACGSTAPAGFGGTSLPQADFAGSDAPMSVSEFNNYVTGHGAGSEPVQLPSISGAIAVVFKKSGVTSLNLTETQICGIFSGTITDWSSISSASGPIRIVYRGDGSGTSFSFLNHLSAVCPANGGASQFKTNQTFTAGVPSYLGSYSSSVAATGNAGVITEVNSATVDGSIGYAEVANGVTGSARFASVFNSHAAAGSAAINPNTGFGSTALSVALSYDQAIADTVDANGRPTLTPLTTSHQCVAVVNPSTYADPNSGYPILAVTYLLGNRNGNGSNAAAVRGILGMPYNTTLRPQVTKIGKILTGYSWLANADLTQSKVDGCVIN